MTAWAQLSPAERAGRPRALQDAEDAAAREEAGGAGEVGAVSEPASREEAGARGQAGPRIAAARDARHALAPSASAAASPGDGRYASAHRRPASELRVRRDGQPAPPVRQRCKHPDASLARRYAALGLRKPARRRRCPRDGISDAAARVAGGEGDAHARGSPDRGARVDGLRRVRHRRALLHRVMDRWSPNAADEDVAARARAPRRPGCRWPDRRHPVSRAVDRPACRAHRLRGTETVGACPSGRLARRAQLRLGVRRHGPPVSPRSDRRDADHVGAPALRAVARAPSPAPEAPKSAR